jgi:hypothetical protein
MRRRWSRRSVFNNTVGRAASATTSLPQTSAFWRRVGSIRILLAAPAYDGGLAHGCRDGRAKGQGLFRYCHSVLPSRLRTSARLPAPPQSSGYGIPIAGGRLKIKQKYLETRRASASQAGRHGFEAGRPLYKSIAYKLSDFGLLQMLHLLHHQRLSMVLIA